MKRTDKKGFTIVELVIVIAVIAILAAVLIPNLSKMVRNAKESSDIQLIRNMNTAMQVESVGGTKRYDTAHDAITAAAAAGYDLTKISLSDKENTILWDEENQCFAYLRKGETTPEYVPNSKKDNTNTPAEKLWKVETEVKENGDYPYSVYWNGGDVATINVKNVGFDAGTATVGTVNYTGNAGKTVVIRTNGGTLNITAPDDTVHHYDFVMTLSVVSVSETHCYYEHGFVGKLEKFGSGKFVTTSTAQFFQTEAEINAVLGDKKDFTTAPKYEQHKFDDNGVSIFDPSVTSSNHKHTEVIDEAVAATCTEAGKTEGKHCETCHAILVAQTDVPATGHKWGAGDICEVCNVNGTKENKDLDASAITVNSYEELRERLTSPGTAEGSELSKITVRLGANIIAPKDGKIIQSNTLDVTLDLHGYTLTLYNSTYDETAKNYGGYGFFVQGAMTIKDTSLGRCGKIVAAGTDNNGEGGLITVEKASASGIIGKSNNQFALLSGTIDSSNNPNGCAILMWHSACVSINGGTVKAKGYAISGSTKDDSSWDKNRLIIDGGNVESEESFAIYHPQHILKEQGAFEINGGKVKGQKGAIYLGGNSAGAKAASGKESGSILTINDGLLISEGDCIIYVNTTYLSSSSDSFKIRVYVNGGRFETKEGAFFVQGKMDKGIKNTSGNKFVKGSSYLFVKLSGGVYNNLSSEKFVCTVDYTSADKAGDPVSKKAVMLDSNYEIVPGTDGTWTVSKKSN